MYQRANSGENVDVLHWSGTLANSASLDFQVKSDNWTYCFIYTYSDVDVTYGFASLNNPTAQGLWYWHDGDTQSGCVVVSNTNVINFIGSNTLRVTNVSGATLKDIEVVLTH